MKNPLPRTPHWSEHAHCLTGSRGLVALASFHDALTRELACLFGDLVPRLSPHGWPSAAKTAGGPII
jgi:hypothetical protein